VSLIQNDGRHSKNAATAQERKYMETETQPCEQASSHEVQVVRGIFEMLPTAHFVSVMQDVTEALNAQEQDVQLRLAHQIRQKFYRAAPTAPGFDIAAAAYPAYETSGDYFDFILLPHNRLGIAVGDVEGHGFGSALVVALTRAYVRSFAAMGLDVDQILTQVNRMLLNDLGDGCFVTLRLASLDVGNHSLVHAGAGHLPGYVLGEWAAARIVPPNQVYAQSVHPTPSRRDPSPAHRRYHRVDGGGRQRVGRNRRS
jgi:serine phosphatase RsbU (regulator of sigma subunit)